VSSFVSITRKELGERGPSLVLFGKRSEGRLAINRLFRSRTIRGDKGGKTTRCHKTEVEKNPLLMKSGEVGPKKRWGNKIKSAYSIEPYKKRPKETVPHQSAKQCREVREEAARVETSLKEPKGTQLATYKGEAPNTHVRTNAAEKNGKI